MFVGGWWDTTFTKVAFLYEYGLGSADEIPIFSVYTETASTYYSVCDFTADLDFDENMETYIVGIRDEAATSNTQSTFSTTSFNFDIYLEGAA